MTAARAAPKTPEHIPFKRWTALVEQEKKRQMEERKEDPKPKTK